MFSKIIRKLVPHQYIDFWLFFYFLVLVFIFLPIIFCYLANIFGFDMQPYSIAILNINEYFAFILFAFSIIASIILIGVIREIYKIYFRCF